VHKKAAWVAGGLLEPVWPGRDGIPRGPDPHPA